MGWWNEANLIPRSFMPGWLWHSPGCTRIAPESFPNFSKIVGHVCFVEPKMRPTPIFVSKNSTLEQKVAKYPIASMYGIFTCIWLMVNVSKYTSPMDPMGMEVDNFFCWGDVTLPHLSSIPQNNHSSMDGNGETSIFYVRIWFAIQLKQPSQNACFGY